MSVIPVRKPGNRLKGYDYSQSNSMRAGVTDRSRPVPTQRIKSLSSLIGAFKTTSSKLIHQNGLSHFAWQRSFYDHVIRNESSLRKIREYIRNNPAIWDNDEENIVLCKISS